MSYDFDGSGTANLNAAAPLAALPLTMACWGKVRVDAASAILMCLGNATDSEIFRIGLHFEGTGDPARLRRTSSGGTNDDTATSTGATLNTWHHVCATVASTTSAAIYIDGGSKVTDTTSRNITGATRLAIGSQYQAGAYAFDTDGKIAHVALWNIALSDAEVASLAGGANPLAVQAANLVAYWPLTADLVDVVGAVTLTDGGGVTFDGADNPTVDSPPGGVSETPGVEAIAWTTYAPTVSAGSGTSVSETPGVELYQWTTYAPTAGTSLVLEPDDEDSDSYDVTTTEVIGSTIYLEGYYDGSGFGGWVNTNCRVSGGVDGATYNVVLDASGKQTAGAPAGNNNTTGSPWTPIVRFKIAGVWGAWSKLSGYSYNGTSKVASGSFVWATGATEARIAYKPVVTVAELDAFRTEIYTSPYAIEPPSSVAASTLPEGVHARLSHGAGPNSVPAGTVDLWGARIGTGPFVGVVTLCTHAQEGVGDLDAMQFIRWMLGGSSEASDFRSRFSVYVYVHNLSGRKCGRTRYNQDVGSDEDSNRAWDDNNSEQTVALRSAIETYDIPLATAIAWWLDYHGQQDANVLTAAYDIYTSSDYLADLEFHDRIALAIGSQVHEQSADSSTLSTGSTKWYARTQRSAPLAVVIEHADAATGYPDAATMHDAFAAATGEILIELANEGYLGGQVSNPAHASWEWTGYAPTASTSGAVDETPGRATWEWATYAPTANDNTAVSETPGPETIEWSGYAPTVVAGITLTPGAEAIEWTTHAPTLAVSGGVNETPGPAPWEWFGYAPTLAGVSFIGSTVRRSALPQSFRRVAVR